MEYTSQHPLQFQLSCWEISGAENSVIHSTSSYYGYSSLTRMSTSSDAPAYTHCISSCPAGEAPEWISSELHGLLLLQLQLSNQGSSCMECLETASPCLLQLQPTYQSSHGMEFPGMSQPHTSKLLPSCQGTHYVRCSTQHLLQPSDKVPWHGAPTQNILSICQLQFQLSC